MSVKNIDEIPILKVPINGFNEEMGDYYNRLSLLLGFNLNLLIYWTNKFINLSMSSWILATATNNSEGGRINKFVSHRRRLLGNIKGTRGGMHR